LRRTNGATQILTTAKEVALGQRDFAQDTILSGIAGGRAIITRGGFRHGNVDHYLVGRRARTRRDIHRREETQRVDMLAATHHESTVEGVAFGKLQLATDDEVTRLGIAGDVDALDIETRALIHQIGDVESAVCHIAIETGTDIDEG